jgi:Hydantoinase B/oxoprolinase
VHTHITNTRIGDVELLERRYPVLVHTFGLRQDSAGSGNFRGGEGVIRELDFLEPLQVSILSEVLDCFKSALQILTVSIAADTRAVRPRRWRTWGTWAQHLDQTGT